MSDDEALSPPDLPETEQYGSAFTKGYQNRLSSSTAQQNEEAADDDDTTNNFQSDTDSKPPLRALIAIEHANALRVLISFVLYSFVTLSHRNPFLFSFSHTLPCSYQEVGT